MDHPQRIRDGPGCLRQLTGIASQFLPQATKERRLQGENKCRGFGRREALTGPHTAQLREEIPHAGPMGPVDVAEIAVLNGSTDKP